jgi:hypothetical protein
VERKAVPQALEMARKLLNSQTVHRIIESRLFLLSNGSHQISFVEEKPFSQGRLFFHQIVVRKNCVNLANAHHFAKLKFLDQISIIVGSETALHSSVIAHCLSRIRR